MCYAVSVIVPVYKVEKYIERCARSLFEQTWKDVEYIFVNDCTPDRSIEILKKVIEEYAERKKDVKIINHASNQGLAMTRNSGLAEAAGKYILQVDSDDWLEPVAIERMYKKMIGGDYDVVWTDYYLEQNNKTERVNQDFQPIALSSINNILSGYMIGAVWNKLIKRSLYINNNIVVPAGMNMWEDVVTTVRLFYFAKNVAYLPDAFYHYVQYNTNAYSRNVNPVLIRNMVDCVSLLENFFREHNEQHIINHQLNYLKLTVKLHLLNCAARTEYNQLKKCYPEATPFILSYDRMNFGNRLGLWLVEKHCYRLSYLIFRIIPRLKRVLK